MPFALLAVEVSQKTTISGVFRGRELTRKERRLSASLEPINTLMEGGIPRGRISEIIGRRSSGKTSLAASFISNATRGGEVAAVIDLADAFDPATMAEAGVDLTRVLWVHPGQMPSQGRSRGAERFLNQQDLFEKRDEVAWQDQMAATLREYSGQVPAHPTGFGGGARWQKNFLRAAELVLEAGGFGLLVVDFGENTFTLAHSSALRIARMAERSGTAVLAIVTRPACGTFAAMSVDLTSARAIFNRSLLRKSDGLAPKEAPYPHPYLVGKFQRYAGPAFPQPLSKLSSVKPRERAQKKPDEVVNSSTGFPACAKPAPLLFGGIEVRASLLRNKLGRSGNSGQWRSLVNPLDTAVETPPSKQVTTLPYPRQARN